MKLDPIYIVRRSRITQRQRVAMGRAIVREPAAFLFDEPLSNLDAKPMKKKPPCEAAEIKLLKRPVLAGKRARIRLADTPI